MKALPVPCAITIANSITSLRAHRIDVIAFAECARLRMQPIAEREEARVGQREHGHGEERGVAGADVIRREPDQRPAGERHHAGQAAAEGATLVVDVERQRRLHVERATIPGADAKLDETGQRNVLQQTLLRRLAQAVAARPGSQAIRGICGHADSRGRKGGECAHEAAPIQAACARV